MWKELFFKSSYRSWTINYISSWSPKNQLKGTPVEEHCVLAIFWCHRLQATGSRSFSSVLKGKCGSFWFKYLSVVHWWSKPSKVFTDLLISTKSPVQFRVSTGGSFIGRTLGTDENENRFVEGPVLCEMDCTLGVICAWHIVWDGFAVACHLVLVEKDFY